MPDSTKRIPHDPEKESPIRPDDDPAGDAGGDAGRAAKVDDPDAEIAAAEREAGTGEYVSREKAGPELARRHREADRRAAEDLGRDDEDDEDAEDERAEEEE